MGFSVRDTLNTLKTKVAGVTSAATQNPIACAVTLCIILMIIIIWVFRKDHHITDRKQKMVKIFVYTFLTTIILLFRHDSYIKDMYKSSSDVMSTVLKNDNLLPEGEYMPPPVLEPST